MRTTTGALLVVVGVALLWLAATGRLARLSDAWAVLQGDAADGGDVKPISGPGGGNTGVPGMPTAFPTLPPLPTLPPIGSPASPPILALQRG